MSFVYNAIQNYFNGNQVVVDTVLPSGETIYENNFSKKVNAEFQGTADYRFQQAAKPNEQNFLLPLYDRNNFYGDDKTKAMEIANKSTLFRTNYNGLKAPEIRQPGVLYSELTGKPLEATDSFLKSSITVKPSRQDNHAENPAWARKMEYFGNNDFYTPKTVTAWSSFHAPVSDNVNGVPIYKDSDLDRVRDSFSLNKEMTNIPPTAPIRVQRPIAGVTRIKERNIDERRAADHVKVGGTFNKTMSAGAGSKTDALPLRFSRAKDLRKKPVVQADMFRNSFSNSNFIKQTPQNRQTKKEKMLFQYIGNPDINVPSTQKRDGIYSKNAPNKTLILNYKGLETKGNGNFIDNRQYAQQPKRNVKTLFGGAHRIYEPEPGLKLNIRNDGLNRVLHFKEKNVYTRNLFDASTTKDITLDVWRPNLQEKRHAVHGNNRLLL